MRLDLFIAQREGLSRNRALFLIERGHVRVNGKTISKGALHVSESDVVTIESDEGKWVSRSALKLLGLLTNQKISVAWKTCLDVGSSTGGFTQVLVEQGAKKVIAVEVGTDQMHEKVRLLSQVELHEQTDIRIFSAGEKVDVIVADVSFISLRDIFPSLLCWTHEQTEMYLLWKPQFEVEKHELSRSGVVRDEKSVQRSFEHFESCARSLWWHVVHTENAAIAGEAGNQEKMLVVKKK